MHAGADVSRLRVVKALYARGRYAYAYTELERLIDTAPYSPEPYLFIADLMSDREPAFEGACRSFVDVNADGRNFADYRVRPQNGSPQTPRRDGETRPSYDHADTSRWTMYFSGVIWLCAAIAIGLAILFGLEYRAPEPVPQKLALPTRSSIAFGSSEQPAQLPKFAGIANLRTVDKKRPACAAFAEYNFSDWFAATTNIAAPRPRC